MDVEVGIGNLNAPIFEVIQNHHVKPNYMFNTWC